jgi:hypothetical protein
MVLYYMFIFALFAMLLLHPLPMGQIYLNGVDSRNIAETTDMETIFSNHEKQKLLHILQNKHIPEVQKVRLISLRKTPQIEIRLWPDFSDFN